MAVGGRIRTRSPRGCTRSFRKRDDASPCEGPLALLATTTAAVHHPCITRAALDASRRHARRSRNRMPEPNHAVPTAAWRRIRLTGLLRENLHLQGFPIERTEPVNHPGITRFGIEHRP